MPAPEDAAPSPAPEDVAGREKAEGRVEEESPDVRPPVWPEPAAPPRPVPLRSPEENGEPLAEISQFPDVSVPGLCLQKRVIRRGQVNLCVEALPLPEFSDKAVHQRRDILLSLPQRRNDGVPSCRTG